MSLVCNSAVAKSFSLPKQSVIARDRAITSCVATRTSVLLSSYFARRARTAFTVDTRTQTGYGLVMTFGRTIRPCGIAPLYNLSTNLNAVGVTGNAYGGVQSPDVVGSVRIDQVWGLFQISQFRYRFALNAIYD
jgi:hypothetical protein